MTSSIMNKYVAILIMLFICSCGSRKMDKQQSKEVVSVETYLEEKKDVQVLSNSEIVERFNLSELDLRADDLTIYPDGTMRMTNPHLKSEKIEEEKKLLRTDKLEDNSFRLDLTKSGGSKESSVKKVDRKKFNWWGVGISIGILILLAVFTYKYWKKLFKIG